MSKYLIIGNDGIPCPRCKRPTQVREHTEITRKHLSQPFYYSRWFNCTSSRCKTTLIMRDEFKVYPKASGEAAERLSAIAEQLSARGAPQHYAPSINAEVAIWDE